MPHEDVAGLQVLARVSTLFGGHSFASTFLTADLLFGQNKLACFIFLNNNGLSLSLSGPYLLSISASSISFRFRFLAKSGAIYGGRLSTWVSQTHYLSHCDTSYQNFARAHLRLFCLLAARSCTRSKGVTASYVRHEDWLAKGANRFQKWKQHQPTGARTDGVTSIAVRVFTAQSFETKSDDIVIHKS